MNIQKLTSIVIVSGLASLPVFGQKVSVSQEVLNEDPVFQKFKAETVDHLRTLYIEGIATEVPGKIVYQSKPKNWGANLAVALYSAGNFAFAKVSARREPGLAASAVTVGVAAPVSIAIQKHKEAVRDYQKVASVWENIFAQLSAENNDSDREGFNSLEADLEAILVRSILEHKKFDDDRDVKIKTYQEVVRASLLTPHILFSKGEMAVASAKKTELQLLSAKISDAEKVAKKQIEAQLEVERAQRQLEDAKRKLEETDQ